MGSRQPDCSRPFSLSACTAFTCIFGLCFAAEFVCVASKEAVNAGDNQLLKNSCLDIYYARMRR